MSQEITSNKKEKRALRDAERKKDRQSKKRKHDETVDLPEQEGNGDAELKQDFILLDSNTDGVSEDAQAAKAPKFKKRKQSQEAAADSNAPKSNRRKQGEDGAADVMTAESAADGTTPKPKKRRKKAKQDAVGTTSEAPDAAAECTTTATTKPKDKFIVFVGNLPYDTTDATLQAHFQKIMPFTLRHRTDPKTKKSKGFAFLEFENYDRMQTCLKLYHHTEFDPAEHAPEGAATAGRNKSKGPRKINVELTVGGGGKTEGRKDKIKVKNQRLEEQRERRQEQERKEKARADRKGEKAKKPGAANQEGAQVGDPDNVGMHPSRLAMMNR